jgi:nucleoside-diphosphate-sugar epimerase
MIISISGKKIIKEHDFTKRVGDMGRAADCTLANKVLGWKPKVSIEEGLKRTYQWAIYNLKSHGKI